MQEYTSIEDSEQPSDCQLYFRKYNPRKNPEEFIVMICVGSMSIGIAFLCIGYIIPREYEFDPSLPAREMESIEIYYAKLSRVLDICIMIGMGFTAVGVIIVSSMTTYSLVKGLSEYHRQEEQASDKDFMMSHDIEMTSYGSRLSE